MMHNKGMFRVVLTLVCSLCLLASSLVTISPAFAQQRAVHVNNGAYLQSLQQYGAQQCVQPPQTIDLMTLSDAQLSLYGLPLHAILDTNPTLWESKLAHARHRTCGTSPEPDQVSEGASSNWAGNVADSGRGTFKVAEVDFRVPSIPTIASSQRVSIWAGVGGDSNHTSPVKLVQAGVGVQRAAFGGQYNTSWWEVAPYNTAQNLPLSRLNAGDEVFASVSSNYKGDGYDYFFIDNETVSSYNDHYLYSQFSDSATGECIVERPTVGNTLTHLANFGTEQLNECGMYSNTQFRWIGAWPHYYYNMYNGSHQLASVGSISSNNSSYPVHFHQTI